MPSPTSTVTRAESHERDYDKAEKGGSAASASDKEGQQEDVDKGLPMAASNDIKGTDIAHIKRRWWLPKPREPYKSFEDAEEIPFATANFLSKITFYCAFLVFSAVSSLWNADTSSYVPQGFSRC